jgi:hypothetical protein
VSWLTRFRSGTKIAIITAEARVDPIKASELARPRFKADPYPFYARMRAETPVSAHQRPQARVIGRVAVQHT